MRPTLPWGGAAIFAGLLALGAWAATFEPATNGAPRMVNPYPYAFFDPARPSPQIVAPPRDWKLDTSEGWGWCPNAFTVWPGLYGYGPWAPGWGMWWCPPYPYAPANVYNLNIKIRF